ncbi:MAG: flagellar hook-length control protein FliK [Bradyrhizobium sp.]
MVSVTPDIASSTFQAPPPRAKADSSPGNDGFAALVDSNIAAAANNSDRAQDASPAPQPPTSDRRPVAARRDDTTATDKSRDITADNPERGDVRDDADAAPADRASTDKPAEPGATKPANSKSADDNSDKAKSASKPSDDTEATDSKDTSAATDPANISTADAVATAIVVPVVATDAPEIAPPVTAIVAAAASSGPLAVTAAATAGGTAASDVTDTTVATPAATDATVKTGASDAKAVTQAATDQTSSDSRQAVVGGDPATTADAELSTASTGIPAAPKTEASQKPVSGVSAGAKATTGSGDIDIKASSTDAPTTTTPTPTPAVTAGTEQSVAAKPTVKNVHTEAVKTEPAGAQTASTAHLSNAAGTDLPSNQASVQANGIPATAVFQTQLQATAPQVQPSFTVTAAAPSAAVPLSGLAMEIAASVQSGKSRFEIRLDPAELGRIDVRIDVDRQGQVVSHLTVEKPETLSMLRQDAPQLQRALNDAGLSTGDSGLQFSLRDQSTSGQNGNQSNPNAQRLIITEDETFPAAAASSYGRMLGSSGGVDIRV